MKRCPDCRIQWQGGSSKYDRGGGENIICIICFMCTQFYRFTIYGEVNYVSFEHKQCDISMIVLQSYVL